MLKAKRLRDMMNQALHTDQSNCIPGRLIKHNIEFIWDYLLLYIYLSLVHYNSSFSFLFMDQEKAYDRVDHQDLWEVFKSCISDSRPKHKWSCSSDLSSQSANCPPHKQDVKKISRNRWQQNHQWLCRGRPGWHSGWKNKYTWKNVQYLQYHHHRQRLVLRASARHVSKIGTTHFAMHWRITAADA